MFRPGNGTIGITQHPPEAAFVYKKFTNGSRLFITGADVSQAYSRASFGTVSVRGRRSPEGVSNAWLRDAVTARSRDDCAPS